MCGTIDSAYGKEFHRGLASAKKLDNSLKVADKKCELDRIKRQR